MARFAVGLLSLWALGLHAGCSARAGSRAAATSTMRVPGTAEACALRSAPATTTASTPRILLEVSLVSPASAASAASVQWTRLLLVQPGTASKLAWHSSALSVTPRLVPGAAPIELDITYTPDSAVSASPQATTKLQVASQQGVFLGQSKPGPVLSITPFLAANDDELAQLRVCKAAPWTELEVQAILPASAASAYPAQELVGSLVRDVHSDLTGKPNRLIINLPASFKAEPTRRYPLIVLLDGQWDFALVKSVTGNMVYDKVFPEAVVVGLSYGGEAPNYDELRSHDYVPTRALTKSGQARGGGAAQYLSFIEKVVLPLMEAEYRADPSRRVLAGTSHGGLFTLFALFERPELFSAYVSISPSVGWDNRDMFRREQAFHTAHPQLERRLWLSSGSEERPDYLENELAFFRQVEQSKYRGITLKVHSVEGTRHASVKGEAYTRALRFAAEPWLEPAASN